MSFFFFFFFFFSSRRRHTRYWRDWSSDVCSSDLYTFEWPLFAGFAVVFWAKTIRDEFRIRRGGEVQDGAAGQIGRASCRERVEISVVAVSVKKKRETNSQNNVTCTD